MTHTIQHLVLTRARELIADHRTWTREAAACNARGSRCRPDDTAAKRFCAYGALWRAAYELTGDRHRALRLASAAESKVLGSASRDHVRLCQINDRKGRLAVLKLLAGALEMKSAA